MHRYCFVAAALLVLASGCNVSDDQTPTTTVPPSFTVDMSGDTSTTTTDMAPSSDMAPMPDEGGEPDLPTTDTTPPTILARSPDVMATGVPLDVTITVTFSEPLDPATVTGDNFKLEAEGQAIGLDVSVDGNGVVSLVPTAGPLVQGLEHTLTVESAVADVAGNTLAQGAIWRFTTTGQAVMELVEAMPRGVDVRRDATITAMFSEELDASSVDDTTISLTAAGEALPFVAEVSGNMISITPMAPLPQGTLVRVEYSTAIVSVRSKPLAAAEVVEFTTLPGLTVIASTPSAGDQEVAVDTELTVTFSAPLDANRVQPDWLRVRVTGFFLGITDGFIPGAIAIDGATLTFRPDAGSWQEYHTNYTIVLSNDIASENQQTLETDPGITFRSLFADPLYSYNIHSAQIGSGGSLDIDQTTNQAFINTSAILSDSVRWVITASGVDRYVLSTVLNGTDLALEGGNGLSNALLTTLNGGFPFTGQIWVFDRASAVNRTEIGDSPATYYMSTLFQGSTRALGIQPNTGGSFDVRMVDRQLEPLRVWWFSRAAPP